ncbi:MAG: tetratricopeptide repeat protein, partial [Acidobacteriaceae bacterium]
MTTSARSNGVRYVLGVVCLALFWGHGGLGQSGPAIAAVGPGCPARIGPEPRQCFADLQAHQTLELRVAVPAGTVRDLTVVQEAGMVRVVLPNPASAETPSSAGGNEVFRNFAGLHSAIHVVAGPGPEGERPLHIENASARAAKVALDFGGTRPGDARTAREQEAELSLAEAENLRQSQGRTAIMADYDRAIADWQVLGDSADEARALTWKAFDLLVSGEAAAGLPVIEQATKLAASLPAVEAANCWKTAGYVEAQLSHYDDARRAYGQALAGYRQTGDVFNQEVVLENLSSVERMQGNKADALQDAAAAETLAEQVHDARGELGISEQLGAIYATSGNLEEAYNAYSRAVSLLQSNPDGRMEGYVWSDLGVVYTDLGDFARAQDALDHAATAWTAASDAYGQINTLDD